MRLLGRYLGWRIYYLGAVAGALVVGIVAGSIFTASSQSSSTTVQACVNRYNGDMRMPRIGGQCASTEYQVSWESVESDGLDAEYVNEGQADSIFSDMIADGEIDDDHLSDELQSILDNAFVNENQENSIVTEMLVEDAIGPNAIADNSIAANQLQEDSVTSSEIQDGAVQDTDLSEDVRGELDIESRKRVRVSGWKFAANNDRRFVTMTCNTNQILIGGGAQSRDGRAKLIRSHPATAQSQQWIAEFQNDTDENDEVRAFALCLTT